METENLDNQIEKTKQVVSCGKMSVDRGSIISIDQPYKTILENQLVILETLKTILENGNKV